MRNKQMWAASGLLLIGGLIYIIFRTPTVLYRLVGDGWPWINAARGCAKAWLAESGAVGDFVVYSLPDGLWVTSYILIIHTIYRNAPVGQRIRCASAIPLIGAATELLQACCPMGYAIGRVQVGTYDVLDLVCYLAPLVCYIILQKIRTSQHNSIL